MKHWKITLFVIITVTVLVTLATSKLTHYGDNAATIYYGWPLTIQANYKDGLTSPVVMSIKYPENIMLNFLFFLAVSCSVVAATTYVLNRDIRKNSRSK